MSGSTAARGGGVRHQREVQRKRIIRRAEKTLHNRSQGIESTHQWGLLAFHDAATGELLETCCQQITHPQGVPGIVDYLG
jgi:hypothetical protein